MCTCEAGWSSTVICDSTFYDDESVVTLYVTPENGNERCQITNKVIKIDKLLPIKLRVEGGEIVLVGNILANFDPKKKINRFPTLCLFNDIEKVCEEHSK